MAMIDDATHGYAGIVQRVSTWHLPQSAMACKMRVYQSVSARAQLCRAAGSEQYVHLSQGKRINDQSSKG
jgi:hypothetical protein